jgi:two-component system, cell cycle sensor histidine kinase and response regulator CckA
MPDDGLPIVLVVDDDRGQVALLSAFLKQSGFRVLSAPSADAALAALAKAGDASKGISLLVTDLDMPGMNGRVFARRMRRQHPAIKVLYVTANPDDLFPPGQLLDANEAFLEKPVSRELLREAINLLMHRGV